MKIKHKCILGHEFNAEMELNSEGELMYSSWSNNLCTVNCCDTVGYIENERLTQEEVRPKWFLRK